MTNSRATYTTQGVISSREEGRRHLRLTDLRPANPLHWKLLSYCYYQLHDASSTRSALGNGKVNDCIQRMSITSQPSRFSREISSLVLEVLARFVQEADILYISEAPAELGLPYFLNDISED